MYPWPWSQKEGSESLQLASEAPEQEPAAERAVKSAQPSRGPELSLPKAKQLTVRRDKQRSDSRR
jgi:hypothetical protein